MCFYDGLTKLKQFNQKIRLQDAQHEVLTMQSQIDDSSTKPEETSKLLEQLAVLSEKATKEQQVLEIVF